MSEPEHEVEAEEPHVTDVPEPDQEPDEDDEQGESAESQPHEPIPDDADADAGDGDPSPPFEQPAQADAQAAAALTQREAEKRFEKAERAFTTYANRIGVIFEEDAQNFIPFPLGHAAPPGFIHKAEAGRVPDDVRANILDYLGLAREQEYASDPETHTCNRCEGKGKTKTGSLVPEYATQTCPTCKGRGAVGLAFAGASSDTNGHVDEPFRVEDHEAKELTDADTWGQPRILPDGRDNPNYGRMPQYWVSVDPWGDTRNLNALDTTAGS